MEAEGGGNQINQRGRIGEFDPREIAELLKLATLLQPLDAQPVVETLERKVYILLYFQLQHGKATASRCQQNIDYSPSHPRKCRDLRIDTGVQESRVKLCDIPHDHTFEPALGLEPAEVT